MTEFERKYLDLLKTQVQEEINYLTSHGHDRDTIPEPCMFCVQVKDRGYRCLRLKSLRDFHSSIVSQKARKQPKSDIGLQSLESKLPLMFPEF
jgi:hypothetical protein